MKYPDTVELPLLKIDFQGTYLNNQQCAIARATTRMFGEVCSDLYTSVRIEDEAGSVTYLHEPYSAHDYMADRQRSNDAPSDEVIRTIKLIKKKDETEVPIAR